jgi:hypothetical protein
MYVAKVEIEKRKDLIIGSSRSAAVSDSKIVAYDKLRRSTQQVAMSNLNLQGARKAARVSGEHQVKAMAHRQYWWYQ